MEVPLTSTRCGCGRTLTGADGNGMNLGTGMLRNAGRAGPHISQTVSPGVGL